MVTINMGNKFENLITVNFRSSSRNMLRRTLSARLVNSMCLRNINEPMPTKGNVLTASVTSGNSSNSSSPSQMVAYLHNHMCALKGLRVKDRTLNLTTTAMDQPRNKL